MYTWYKVLCLAISIQIVGLIILDQVNNWIDILRITFVHLHFNVYFINIFRRIPTENQQVVFNIPEYTYIIFYNIIL